MLCTPESDNLLNRSDVSLDDFKRSDISSIDRQADLFLQLAVSLSSCEPMQLMPSFSALLSCIRAGWRPSDLPCAVVKIALSLTERKEVQYALTGRDILKEGMKNSVLLNNQVTKTILRDLEHSKDFHAAGLKFDLLIDGLDVFMDHSVTGLVSKLAHSSSSGQKEESAENVKNFIPNLGDNVEILLEDKWTAAVVVRINSQTQECTVEYNELGDGSSVSTTVLKIILLKSGLIRKLVSIVALSSTTREQTDNASSTELPNPPAYSLTELIHQFDQVNKITSLLYEGHAYSKLLPSAQQPPKVYCSHKHACQLVVSCNKTHCSKCRSSGEEDDVIDDEGDDMCVFYSWHCSVCNDSICSECNPPKRPACARTLCLMGEASEKIRSAPTTSSLIVSELSPGSVIDVLDSPDSDYYQLADTMGYVRKQLDRSGCWKESKRDRYAIHEKDLVAEERTLHGGRIKVVYELNIEACRLLAQSTQLHLCMKELELKHHANTDSINVRSNSDLQERYLSLREEFLLKSQELLSFVTPLGESKKAADREGRGYEDDEDDLELDPSKDMSSLELDIGRLLLSANIFKRLLAAAGEGHEKLVIMYFEWLFHHLVEVVTSFAEALNASQEFYLPPPEYVKAAYTIINQIFWSESRTILIVPFFRCLIAKAGMKAKAYAVNAAKQVVSLRSVENLQSALNAFKTLNKIGTSYAIALTHPFMSLSHDYLVSLSNKLVKTVGVLGHGHLADEIISNTCLQCDESQCVVDFGLSNESVLQSALRFHILETTKRFAPATKKMRCLLRVLCKYCKQDMINHIESAWKEVLAHKVYLECISYTAIMFSHNDAQSNRNSLIDKLMILLKRFRYISRVDMSITGQCGMSADLAFGMAFRRLPKEVSLEITKIVAIHIALLVDALKVNTGSGNWPSTLDELIDIIQVGAAISMNKFIKHRFSLLFFCLCIGVVFSVRF
ncbi:SH3 domain-containing protein [archaeon]|nr:MAG: SH3 domain-containing protein [archaeon]